MYRQINRELLDFIESSPTSHFVIHNLKSRLFAEGYEELFENEQWALENGGRYFVTRDNSSLIAFRVPEAESVSFHAILSHCDSPSLKLKPDFKEETLGIKKLSVEKYGGLISDSFFDIPLTLAGNVVLSEDYGISERLVKIDNFGIIPRIPPHFSTKQETNPSVDMYLMYGLKNSSDALCRIAKSLSVMPEEILSHDLYLVPYGKGTVWGENDEFISCPRLDNLQSVFASLAGFLNSDESTAVPVMAVFDGEEIGSGGTSGAASDLLSNTLERISFALGKTGEEHFSSLAQSFFVSADAAHSLHPNHPELFDKNTAPLLNEGIAIKYNSQKRYTTTALSAAIFSEIAKTAQVPCQIYANRSDIPGGTTLGHIVQGKVSVMCVDVGASVLSMHSSSETAGAIDTEYMSRAFEMFYSVSIEKSKNGYSIN